MSVAELCRRLGSAPATADNLSTGATPVLVGDLLRREGRPPVRAEVPAARVAPSPESEPDEDQPVVPTPRSRGDACRTALGAGGLVVAGSVLGAALLAAAGVGGPLPFGQGGDDGVGQFQGEGTLVRPGTAYGSVRGRDVVARSGLFRAISYDTPFRSTTYTPFRSTAGTATGTGARAAGAATVVPVAGPAGPVQAVTSTGAVIPASPATGVGTPTVRGETQGADPSEAVAPVPNDDVTQTAAPVPNDVTQAAASAVGSLAQATNSIVAAVVAPAAPVITPLANGVAASVTPVAELAGTITEPALESVTPVVDAVTPLVNAAAPAVRPVLVATDSVIQPVVAATEPAVAPALHAAGTVLAVADPLLPSLQEELTDPVVDRAGTVADDLPAAPGSVAQAAIGEAVSAVRDAAAGTTSAVQGAAAADPVLPVDPAGTARQVVARAETPVDPPTLPIQIIPPQATSSPQPAAADAPGALTKIVPSQATGAPEPAAVDTTLPTRVLPSQDVDVPAAETTEALTKPQTAAQAEPPTEPLRIVTPLGDPESSAEPRTALLQIVAPEKSDDERADSTVDTADTPADRRIPAADALTDKAGALLDP